MWYITLINLCVLKHSYIAGINLTELEHMIHLIYFEFYFVEDFCIYIHQGYWPIIFFSCSVLVWFWYHSNAGLVKWICKHSLLFYFLESLRRIGISSSLNVWQNSPVKSSGPGFFVLGRFLITDSIFLLVTGLFRFSVLHDSVLVGCMFLGIYPFLLNCPIYWHIIVHSSLLWSFVFLWYQLLYLFFHF